MAEPDGDEEPAAARRPFFLRFLRLAGPFWTAEDKWIAWGLTLLLVLLTVAQVTIPVRINSWNAALFDALEQRSFNRFVVQIGVIFVILAFSMAITSTHMLVKRQLQLSWRRWLTRRLLSTWMESGRQFQVIHIPGEHDNPDGRIAEDARTTTEAAIDLAHSLLYCLLILGSFVKILWSLSGPFQLGWDGFSVAIPGYLVWVAIAYASTASFLALAFGWPLIRATDRRQTAEANFRFGLVRGRENSEAIALLRGEPDERRRLLDLFKGIQKSWFRQSLALARLFLFTQGYSILSQAFPILIVAPRYIAGHISLGGLMQTSQAFGQLAGSLSWPVDNLQRVAEWRASVERVLALSDALTTLDAERESGEIAGIMVATGERPVLGFHDLCITNPDGSTQVRCFNAEVTLGERVLISGEPGAAIKLFKVVAGLWPWGHGRVELPKDAQIFFMPQRPYLPFGRLRSALGYPAGPGAFDDAALAKALIRVGLGSLTERLDEVGLWEQMLTTDEQQRLGFARLLLHRPNWIFLEEATDALAPEGEAEMLTILTEDFPAATVLTIGYHSALEAFHHRKLMPLERRAQPRPPKRREDRGAG